MMVGPLRFLVLIPMLVSVFSLSHAASWYVDGAVGVSGDGTSWATAVKTIQEGIEKAFNGDVVNVAQGVYVENIQFRGKNILLRSRNPNDPAVVAATIIDGDKAGSVVTFLGTENASCFLSGFTIRNGETDGSGGGIRGNGALATIQLNLIGLNEAGSGGGGLHRCNGLLRDNVITQNEAEDYGGGLAECGGRVVNNMITQNSASSSGGGLSNCLAEIRNNVIRHNTAGYGGGLYRCDGRVHNNVISGNEAASDGGGTYLCMSLVNNTIVANSATTAGGGVVGTIWGEADMANCIVWGNEANRDEQVYLPPLSTRYCCIQDWGGGGTGNTALAPDFVDPNGPDGDPFTTWDNDYRLTASSVCIDRGSNDAVVLPQLDRAGNLRIAYGNLSLTIDMGAFEYNSRPFAITRIAPFDDNSLSLTWNSQPANFYRLWFLGDASTAAWVEGPTIASQGATTSHDTPIGTSLTGFWIVQMVE
jgi:hypothetical protein